jgi:amino acid efflux transporter
MTLTTTPPLPVLGPAAEPVQPAAGATRLPAPSPQAGGNGQRPRGGARPKATAVGAVHAGHAGAGIGPARGTALYLASVIGPGVLALPGLGVSAAGPASIVVWLALLAASAPVAATFAALGARYPDAGGIATFVRHAYGHYAGLVVGWWFYTAVPVAALAGALIAARYTTTLLHTGTLASAGAAGAVLVGVFAVNLAGLRLSGRVQLCLCALLVAILVAAITAGAAHLQATHLHPFLPHGLVSLPHTACLLYVGLTGWEAATHLSGEFRDPRRHLRLVTAATWGIAAVLYLGLAVTTVAALGPTTAAGTVPVAALLEYGLGPAARPVTAAAALLLSIGACTTFVAGAARLGAALARQRAMPGWLAGGRHPNGVPLRSLAVQALATTVLGVLYPLAHLRLDHLLQVFSALLAALAAAGCAGALRLLPGRAARCCALTATAVTVLVAACAGPMLAAPALAALAATVWHRLTARRAHTATAAAQPARGPAPPWVTAGIAVFPPAGLERIDTALLHPA